MIRVLLVDDRTDFRRTFARLLERQPDLEVVAAASSLPGAHGSHVLHTASPGACYSGCVI
jgi:DNA-binding NarL/FixJ family response regulator